MARTVEEVARHHMEAVVGGDPADMAVDYAGGAILDRAGELHKGREAIEAYFRSVPDRLGSARVVFDELNVDGATATFRWHLEGPDAKASGTDVCTNEGAHIVHQRVHLDATDF
jgi:hypothetical protein